MDYQKVFESVEIAFVMSTLKHQGIGIAHINILKHIYNKGTSFIHLQMDSKPFPLQRGVRQGNAISPRLFTAGLESVFQNLNWNKKGSNIDCEYLNNLRFADDNILLLEEPQELQNMLTELNKANVKVGIKMNLKKT